MSRFYGSVCRYEGAGIHQGAVLRWGYCATRGCICCGKSIWQL